VLIKDIIGFLEEKAPLFLQEAYDNSGLQWGNPELDVKKVLVCLDFTERSLEAAAKENAELIISHHPPLFKPLRSINTASGIGALIAECIKKDICVYAMHTNYDTAKNGLNYHLAKTLKLEQISALKTHYREALYKIVVFVPEDSLSVVRNAMYEAGAGWIGNYSDCGFFLKGNGTFKPLEGTNPYIGQKGKLEIVDEYRLETVVPENLLNSVIQSMIKAHPYEEVAYDVYRLENGGYEYSLGAVGKLAKSMEPDEFISHVKEKLKVPNVRIIGSIDGKPINSVAVFCGSFDGDIKPLVQKNVDALVTGDLKYHDAQQLKQSGILTVDAGHYHTEKLFVKAISDMLKSSFKDVIIIEHHEQDVFEYR
jgi:dinuclear metal center YbgI/SA1388 family protein